MWLWFGWRWIRESKLILLLSSKIKFSYSSFCSVARKGLSSFILLICNLSWNRGRSSISLAETLINSIPKPASTWLSFSSNNLINILEFDVTSAVFICINCLVLSTWWILRLRALVPLLLFLRWVKRAFVSFSNNLIMSGIKLIGSGILYFVKIRFLI